MPAYKDSKTGTWFVKFYCKDWTGENKQIKKRGFVTKREALDYERNYKIRQENNLDMTFGEFWKLYTEDVKNYVKLNTWLTKEQIVDTKILPYFKNFKMNEITPGDVKYLKISEEEAIVGFHSSDETHRISALSSGERHLLVLLTIFVIEGNRRQLFMVDEPELSLNMNWQRKLLPLLSELAPNAEIVVASHSPSIAKANSNYLVELR